MSGYRRFEFASIVYDEKSSLVDKRFKISNLDLVRDMEKVIRLGKRLLEVQQLVSRYKGTNLLYY